MAKPIVGVNDIETVRPDLVEMWDDERNDRKPKDYTADSEECVYWICRKHGISYEASIRDRADGCGLCPECKDEIRRSMHILKPRPGRSLQEVRPDVAKQWDRLKNGGLLPTDIGYGSAYEAHWICEKGHEWVAKVNSRTSHGKGDCPVCIGRKVLAGFNDLATYSSFLESEWDEAKNGGRKASEYTYMSDADVWWRCSVCGCSWHAQICNRVGNGTGCPDCVDYKRRTSFPQEAIYLYVSGAFPDAEKNARPSGVNESRFELDIWIPSIRTAIEYDGQHWHSNPNRDIRKDTTCSDNDIRLIRVREPGCTDYDFGEVTVIRREKAYGNDSLAKTVSDVMRELGVDDVDVDIKRDMHQILVNMTNTRRDGSIAQLRPDLMEEWSDKNVGIDPNDIPATANIYVYWKCPKGHDDYMQPVRNRYYFSSGCHKCATEVRAKARMTPPEGGSLQDKSDVVSKMWHDELNGDKTPSDVRYGSNKEAWWKCPDCGEPFLDKICKVLKRKDKRCRRCRKGGSRDAA